MGKPWYRSKTVWVNGIAVLAAVADAALGMDLIPGPTAAAWVAAALAGANLFLRKVTTEPITL